jgi:hypothetical protein
MFRLAIAILAIGVLSAAPVWAVDRNHDGLDDSSASDMNIGTDPEAHNALLDEGDIAIVDTGDYSVSVFVTRLTGLGYPVYTIPADSDLEVLLGYSLVILPVSHADSDNYDTFDGLAADYIEFVNTGGGLWLGQPNPFGMPDNSATITWVPYLLTLDNSYLGDDCALNIVDPNHCITEGLPNTQFSFPGDTALALGAEWDILVEGAVTGSPGVMFAEYGSGKILVELTHPAEASLCPMDDDALDRYVACTMGGVVAVEGTTWSTVKSLYR